MPCHACHFNVIYVPRFPRSKEHLGTKRREELDHHHQHPTTSSPLRDSLYAYNNEINERHHRPISSHVQFTN
ncbi:hypothetical protein BU24DRAFT_423503 [Aaosphaeria arxii CBS 175.79]|uniref:Uncharacterized protein n=1 Tax=Aaosphaeria arxii CBS 175.79 TaxID=1450172 RepID=A0A6A5XNS7_9PLEO|nr:uncharacterized protein BU24DRAFT_423503 [Aaosphaeria arxii CBS 175.79]KAF2014593.1 hypothetical protein BU24DRAFT_423503 [Aaosphaeria arxii CBS 175.79]